MVPHYIFSVRIDKKLEHDLIQTGVNIEIVNWKDNDVMVGNYIVMTWKPDSILYKISRIINYVRIFKPDYYNLIIDMIKQCVNEPFRFVAYDLMEPFKILQEFENVMKTNGFKTHICQNPPILCVKWREKVSIPL
jgi:hypothetical protein